MKAALWTALVWTLVGLLVILVCCVMPAMAVVGLTEYLGGGKVVVALASSVASVSLAIGLSAVLDKS